MLTYSMSKLVSIICPARDESDSVDALVDAMIKIRHDIRIAFNKKINLEFIIIDNASTDDTVEKIAEAVGSDNSFKIIRHLRNLGLQNSILTGLKNANGDAAVILQFDLQDPPELIIEMVTRWLGGEKYIITQIKKRNSGFLDSFSRKVGYIFLNFVAGVKVVQNSGDFWLIDRRLIDQVVTFSSSRPFFRTILPKLRSADSIIKYDRRERVSGSSNFNFLAKYEFFIDAVLSDPRRIAMLFYMFSIFSSLVSFSAFLSSFFIAFGNSGTDLIIFFASLNLFMVTFCVEFLWRLYIESPNKQFSENQIIKK